MKKVLIIDNYDSFTYNLVHYFEALNCEVTVFRNDEFDLEEILPFDKIVLSPGPGIPDEAGLLKLVIQTFAKTKSILGICLGQQAIGEVFGGKLKNLNTVFHGVATQIKIIEPSEVIFNSIHSTIKVGRYHSWVIDSENFPDELTITAIDEANEIMAISHKTLDIKGVQFHPESILTPNGKQILENWLNS